MISATLEKIKINSVAEGIVIPAINTTTFSLNSGSIFYIYAYNPGTTLNLTNVDTSGASVCSITFISPTGIMVAPTTFTINSVTQTVKWAYATVPTASRKYDYWSFNIVVINSAVSAVTGLLTTFA